MDIAAFLNELVSSFECVRKTCRSLYMIKNLAEVKIDRRNSCIERQINLNLNVCLCPFFLFIILSFICSPMQLFPQTIFC